MSRIAKALQNLIDLRRMWQLDNDPYAMGIKDKESLVELVVLG
jgi:hypothetical protein